jgi:hypothetical protein
LDQVPVRVRSQYNANNAKIVSQRKPLSQMTCRSISKHTRRSIESLSAIRFLAIWLGVARLLLVLRRGVRGTPSQNSFNWRQQIVSSGRAMGGKGHLVEPQKPLGAATFYDEPTRKRKQPASKREDKAAVKAKGKPTGEGHTSSVWKRFGQAIGANYEAQERGHWSKCS